MNRQALLGAACLAAVALSAGCKPKSGGTCKLETKEICVDNKQALVCHEGKWEEMSCKGPAGCAKSGAEATCDQAVADEKEVCNVASDVICTADKKGMLECRGNRWTFSQACLGARGCAMGDKKVVCDNSVAKVDDACHEADDSACTPDGKAALVCKDGKFQVALNCRGPKACKIAADEKKPGTYKVDCDDTVAVVGEPCDKENHFACATDERSVVKCVGKKFVQDEKCRTKEKCTIRGESVGCF